MNQRKSYTPSFYKSNEDLILAMKSITEYLLKKPEKLPIDEKGFIPVKFLYEFLRNEHPQLNYISRNNIVEFFYKDLAREIRFKGDNQIKYDVFKNLEENEVLTEGTPIATLYNSPTDLNAALITGVSLLKTKNPAISWDKSGCCKISELCEIIKNKMPFLSYISKNHIIELFFKDKKHKIMISKDIIKYRIKKIVQPPDTLYFGTLYNLGKKMVEKGVYSNTRGYVKLYSNPELAKKFASKFVIQNKDKVISLIIDAKKAYSDGIVFSTYNKNEYIVSNIDKEYIKWPEKNIDEKKL